MVRIVSIIVGLFFCFYAYLPCAFGEDVSGDLKKEGIAWCGCIPNLLLLVKGYDLIDLCGEEPVCSEEVGCFYFPPNGDPNGMLTYPCVEISPLDFISPAR